MSLTLDPSTIRAGQTTFAVTNDASTEDHEMVVVKLKSPDEIIPVIKSKHRIDEEKLSSLGEAPDLKPGASGELKADLEPGTYLVFCNIRGHFEAGMSSKLVVTP